jgi:hypothetical protein
LETAGRKKQDSVLRQLGESGWVFALAIGSDGSGRCISLAKIPVPGFQFRSRLAGLLLPVHFGSRVSCDVFIIRDSRERGARICCHCKRVHAHFVGILGNCAKLEHDLESK